MGEEKKNNHKGFKIFIIVFIIMSLFLLPEENQEKAMKIIKSLSNKEKTLHLVDSFTYEDDILDMNIYDDIIVKWNNNKVSFLSIDGEKIFDKQFNFADPSIYYGENHIYIMDRSRGDIYSLNSKGETRDRLELDKEIFNFEESNGNIIYHWKSAEGENINILDKSGIQIGHRSYEDKSILRYSVNEKGSRDSVAIFDINEGEIKSHIEFYGEHNDKLYGVDINREIVVYLNITPKDEIVALTDNGIYFIKDGEILWEKELNLIKDIYIKDEEIYILHSNYFQIIDFKGNMKSEIGFSEEYRRILPLKNNTLVYGDKYITIVEDGKEILKEEEEIIDIYIRKDKILVWGPEEIKTYELVNKD